MVLASGSPRRRELLDQIGLAHEVRPADLDETPRPDEPPIEYVARLAREKAGAVAGRLNGDVVVIAADTTVEVDGRILGKPEDHDDARSMLRALSGRTHHVHTGVAVLRAERVEFGVSSTAVEFVELSDAAIEWYVTGGEPFDKAGGYALQGAGGVFVAQVSGSVSGVIGLPLTLLAELLGRHGIEVTGPARS